MKIKTIYIKIFITMFIGYILFRLPLNMFRDQVSVIMPIEVVLMLLYFFAGAILARFFYSIWKVIPILMLTPDVLISYIGAIFISSKGNLIGVELLIYFFLMAVAYIGVIIGSRFRRTRGQNT